MQATERTHLGGKPANPQPKISLTKDFAFHRQELKVVNSRFYSWASNICHLEDTDVQVEDLSEIDIDAQLAQDIQDPLSKALNCDAESMSEYSRSEQPEELVTEEFTIPGPFGVRRVRRITCNHIDVRHGRNQYSESPIAKRILNAAEANVAPRPSDAQVKHVACRIVVEEHGGELPDVAVREQGPKLLHEAQKDLFIHRDDAAYKLRLDREMQTSEKSKIQTPKILSLVEKAWRKMKMDNKFHQYLLDTERSNLCERIEGFDVVILRDKNGQLICGVFTKALQKLFPDGTVDKMSRASEAFTWRFPFKTPDEIRHPTSQAVHLARYPDKDVRSEECKQPHFAVCGVEHYGAHHEIVKSNGLRGLHFQEFSHNPEKCPRVYNSSAWKEEFPKLKEGVYGIAEKVSRLSLESWDPDLYMEYKKVNEWLPDALRAKLAKTGDNLYGYMAHLADPLTEGHIDSTDWMGGMASLTCFGEFDGGDLVLPELGVRIPFPSGSNCHLRGRELWHLITGYEGTRHSIVLTNKESVRKTFTEFEGRVKEKGANAVKLQSKDRKDWSDDEAELHEAYLKGRSAILGLIWKSEMERREAAKKELQAKNAQQKEMKAQQKAIEAQQKAIEAQQKAKNNKRKADEEIHKADDAQGED